MRGSEASLTHVVLPVEGGDGEQREGAGEPQLGEELAAVRAGAHRHRHLGGDDLLLLLGAPPGTSTVRWLKKPLKPSR